MCFSLGKKRRKKKMKTNKFYLTTPIYYTSGSPHLGHLYTTVAADIISRYKKMKNFEVLFSTGSDENSLKVLKAAERAGKDPKEFVDLEAKKWERFFTKFSISFDRFIRTTDDDHKRTVQSIVQKLFDKGFIIKGKYEGWYCVDCETFWLEGDVPSGACPTCGRDVQWISEDNYFFKLSAFQKKLLDFYEQNPTVIEPESRFNEVVSMIKMGLNDLSISRSSIKWGIPLPFDPQHVVYVWFDALINYLTVPGYGTNPEKLSKFWPADLHLMSKDIIRFHCVIWPAMLMALDLPVANKVYVHGWWLTSGEKMSKSKGNIIDPNEVIADLSKETRISQALSVDVLRLFMFRESSFGDDAVFTDARFASRYNFDLANDLGNLISRVYAMTHKNFNDSIPSGLLISDDFKQNFDYCVKDYFSLMDRCKFKEALETIWCFINYCNKLIETSKPWELIKQNKKEELENLIYSLLDGIRNIALFLSPFMPSFSAEVLSSLGKKTVHEDRIGFGKLEPNHPISQLGILFPRIQTYQHASSEITKGKEPAKEKPLELSIDEFAKLDLRIGEVLEAKQVEKSDKLLVLQVKVGENVKQIVAGIALHYKPEEMVGKKIVVVNNLKPAMLRGVESQGMLLAASNELLLTLVTPEKDIGHGSKVK